ncbi:uncharacterized protein [Nicotiana sylvestris]|uniref:uncharacterized protein n=1 Tax=Nicotiana sylvestris TaxID=4096 RepID=UPI00388CD414
MDKFLIKLNVGQPSSSFSRPSASSQINPEIQRETHSSPHLELNLESLEVDPKERLPISSYGPNIRDEVRRYYIQMGPCKPIGHVFPKTKFGNKMRQFCPTWFKGPYSQRLEYSIKADAAFCLCCYLFKNELESRGNGGDAFTKDGFRGWNKAVERLKAHVGDVNNIYHKCFNRMHDLKNQRQSILSSFDKQSEKVKSDYRMRLKASIDVARFLLRWDFHFVDMMKVKILNIKALFLNFWNGMAICIRM